jgi:small subunit ribosomal protein S20
MKAHRQSLKHREQNRQLRSRLRGALRDVRAALANKTDPGTPERVRQTISLIDRMAAKGIIHKNAAARYKSRMATRLR